MEEFNSNLEQIPSLEIPEEIVEILGMSVDSEIYDRSLEERKQFEYRVKNATRAEYKTFMSDALKFRKLEAYLYILTNFPDQAPGEIKKFGVENFIVLLEKEKEKEGLKKFFDAEKMVRDYKASQEAWTDDEKFFKEEPPEIRKARILLSEIRSNIDWRYPEYQPLGPRLGKIRKEIEDAGITIGGRYRSNADYPKGAKGDIITIDKIDYLRGQISGAYDMQADPNSRWHIDLKDLEKIDQVS